MYLLRFSLLALAALVLAACDRGPQLTVATNGTVYLLDAGEVYRLDGGTMIAVQRMPSREAPSSDLVNLADTLAAMNLEYQLKLKSFGQDDVRFLLTATTTDGSSMWAADRRCWEDWTSSSPYLRFELVDSDGFRHASIPLTEFSDRSSNHNPDGEPEGFTVRGAVDLGADDLQYIQAASPLWIPCM